MDIDHSLASEALDGQKVKSMIDACLQGQLHIIHSLITENQLYACQQDTETGTSPLMAAALVGNSSVCQFLLENGAPWNAVDRSGKCAGNYATEKEHWNVVNILVEWGTRSELILGMVERKKRDASGGQISLVSGTGVVEQEPCTKPDYLRQRLVYSEDGKALMDEDKDAVMMEWERPLMRAHAQVLMEGNPSKTVMNIGFGMGIIDTILQEYCPNQHIIVEAHPDVYKKMIQDKWNEKPNVRVCFGKWQDVIPQLISEGIQVDAIFYDTYGEHFLDLEDFHELMVQVLSQPHGVYSFFNGLAPDNLFFHGVACQCVKLQLSQKGLDSDFLSCEIQVKDEEWKGIRRKYWHGRDTYYLPRCTWNQGFLQTGSLQVDSIIEEARKQKNTEAPDSEKRQRMR